MSDKDEPVDEPQKMDLDAILVDELGQFGWFQMKTLLLAAVIIIFCAWGCSEYVFTTARIATRCYIPECDAEDPEFRPGWLPTAIPDNDTSFNSCQRFAISNVSTATPVADTCPDSLFDRNELVACDRLVYENTHSVVYDFDLGCNEWRRSLIGSIRTVGTLLGLPIAGFVSDRWGRRTALVYCTCNTAWLGLLRYFANTYVGFTISQFMEAFLGTGSFSSTFILMLEVVGPKYRVLVGAAINCFFSVGQLAVGLIAWVVPNWRDLTLALHIPQFLSIAYIWIMTESVRWHLSKGNFDKSKEILYKIAKTNGKVISQKSLKCIIYSSVPLNVLRVSVEKNKRNEDLIKEENKSEPWVIVTVFRHKEVLLRCIVCPLWWVTMTFIFYGMSINAVNLSGNSYVNFMSVTAAQIPGYFTAVLLMDKIGRKPMLIAAFWICAACQFSYIFVPEDQFTLLLTFYLMSTFSNAAVVTPLYIYTSELFPTRYRHRLFAFCSTIGRIGSILAPLSPSLGLAVWAPLPYLLYGSLATLSGALVFLTPETLGSKFPDTMEEAADIGKNNKGSLVRYLSYCFIFFLSKNIMLASRNTETTYSYAFIVIFR